MAVFTPTPSGFKELPGSTTNGSINSVAEHLGYHPDQVYFHLGDLDREFDIQMVVLEVFTMNVVFVGTKDGVTSIDLSKLNHYLRDLTDDDLYNSYKVNPTLTDGIENKSLPASFLGRVLGIDNIEENGVFYSTKLDKYLYFTDGLLTDFQSSDGLNQAAKRLHQINPNIIEAYEAQAKRYWGNDNKKVLSEINTQADAWASTPQSVGNEYVPLHTDANGIVNFHMLLVCHYSEPITLTEFLTLNHGRYQKRTDAANTYHLGSFTYEFDTDGELLDASM